MGIENLDYIGMATGDQERMNPKKKTADQAIAALPSLQKPSAASASNAVPSLAVLPSRSTEPEEPSIYDPASTVGERVSGGINMLGRALNATGAFDFPVTPATQTAFPAATPAAAAPSPTFAALPAHARGANILQTAAPGQAPAAVPAVAQQAIAQVPAAAPAIPMSQRSTFTNADLAALPGGAVSSTATASPAPAPMATPPAATGAKYVYQPTYGKDGSVIRWESIESTPENTVMGKHVDEILGANPTTQDKATLLAVMSGREQRAAESPLKLLETQQLGQLRNAQANEATAKAGKEQAEAAAKLFEITPDGQKSKLKAKGKDEGEKAAKLYMDTMEKSRKQAHEALKGDPAFGMLPAEEQMKKVEAIAEQRTLEDLKKYAQAVGTDDPSGAAQADLAAAKQKLRLLSPRIKQFLGTLKAGENPPGYAKVMAEMRAAQAEYVDAMNRTKKGGGK